MNPGTTVICFASNDSVVLPTSALMSAVLPTAVNLPLFTANASARGAPASTVYTFALKTTRSGSRASGRAAPASEPPGDDPAIMPPAAALVRPMTSRRLLGFLIGVAYPTRANPESVGEARILFVERAGEEPAGIELTLGAEERSDLRVRAFELRGGIVQLIRQEEASVMIGAEIDKTRGQTLHTVVSSGIGRLIEIQHDREQAVRRRVVQRGVLAVDDADGRVQQIGAFLADDAPQAFDEADEGVLRNEVLVQDVGLVPKVVLQVRHGVVHRLVARDEAALALAHRLRPADLAR